MALLDTVLFLLIISSNSGSERPWGTWGKEGRSKGNGRTNGQK